MKYNSDDAIKAKAIDWFISFSSDAKRSLSRTHEEKVKIIVDSEDMTTEEKLKALDQNDFQLLLKILAGGAIASSVVISIIKGVPIDTRFLGKTNRQLAA